MVGLGAVTISDNLVFMNEGELGGGVQVTTQICTYGDVTSVITFNVVRDNLALDFDEIGAGDGGGIFVGADGSSVDFACLGGKSEVIACLIAHELGTKPGSFVLVIAPSERQSKELYPTPHQDTAQHRRAYLARFSRLIE